MEVPDLHLYYKYSLSPPVKCDRVIISHFDRQQQDNFLYKKKPNIMWIMYKISLFFQER